MDVTLLLTAIFAAGVWAACNSDDILGFAGFISAFLPAIVLVAIAISYPSSFGEVAEFKEVQRMVSEAEADRPFNVAFSLQVAEANRWLASAQHWNRTWFCDPFWTDEVESLKPIRIGGQP